MLADRRGIRRAPRHRTLIDVQRSIPRRRPCIYAGYTYIARNLEQKSRLVQLLHSSQVQMSN